MSTILLCKKCCDELTFECGEDVAEYYLLLCSYLQHGVLEMYFSPRSLDFAETLEKREFLVTTELDSENGYLIKLKNIVQSDEDPDLFVVCKGHVE